MVGRRQQQESCLWSLFIGRMCRVRTSHWRPATKIQLQVDAAEQLGMKAIWKDKVIAESDDTVVVEGNHYFPPKAIRSEYFEPSDTHTVCPWKGTASYYTLAVDGQQNPDAAWYYPDTKDAAKNIQGRIAFWKGVQVRE
jgi:uncharacterized protein (DUF427 family)